MAKNQTEGKKRVKPWTIAEAQIVYEQIEPIAKSHGFILSIAGSVIRVGQGRDLDLIAVPTNPDSDRDAMIKDIMASIHASRSAIEHRGEAGTSFSLLSRRRVIDLLVVER